MMAPYIIPRSVRNQPFHRIISVYIDKYAILSVHSFASFFFCLITGNSTELNSKTAYLTKI